MKKAFREKLGRERLYCDGGTGSVLQAKGLKGGELPERWNLERPEDIIDLAKGYFEAGSDIVNSNTFGANRLHYPDPEELARIIRAGVAHVREGMRLAGRDDGYVALDIGPTGRLLSPMGDLPFEEAVEIFAEVVRAGAPGADLVLIETMSDAREAKAAVLAAKENCDLPVCVTCVFDEQGKMLTGGTVQSIVPMLEGLRVDAVGLNCSLGPEQLLPVAEAFVRTSSLPVICNPNAGLPRSEGGKIVYDLSAEDFARGMEKIAACGVHVLGGCCGTTPAYIRQMTEATRNLPFFAPEKKHRTVVSGISGAVEIGQRPVLVGERINPTGKKRLKEALRAGDFDYILQQGIEQEDAGADILDVNVGLPEIDEPAVMEQVVERLQGIVPLPLQIDTSSTAALERGLRACVGKPLINSVNGKRESLESVLPLAAKYGGVVVGLTLDENGIPDSADGRIAIARRIIEEAAKYGIGPEDVIIDPLALTVSADPGAAKVTLETVRRVRDELGGRSILGVSNISFGLPQREIVNAAFFTMAMQQGLSAAIMNPGSGAMMGAYRAFLALGGMDPGFRGLIDAYASAGEPKAAPKAADAAGKEPEENGLSHAVIHGMEERAAREAAARLQAGADPLVLVNEQLIPALDTVGRSFEAGRLFLPQLLLSAEAARAAFDVIKGAMQGRTTEVKGRVILATVKGDIHDIGKNIVKVLLENYGYEVLDLGKDVPAETVAETAVRENIALVGLSALMTTTVAGMEETIRLLRERKPDTKVVVGGAVMTREYAEAIGADHYAREAMDTVRYADQVFGLGSAK